MALSARQGGHTQRHGERIHCNLNISDEFYFKSSRVLESQDVLQRQLMLSMKQGLLSGQGQGYFEHHGTCHERKNELAELGMMVAVMHQWWLGPD
jgi:hypothetical protein